MSKVKIPIHEGELHAEIAMPKNKDKPGVIIVVHGDGALNATADGAYKPAWEAMTCAGYAVISWDKQGVDGSSGNWLKQSMEDRTNEVLQVIEWVKTQDQFDKNNIGIWGASQAGWVVPKVAGKADIAFCILCAPAINWINQGEYYLTQSMQHLGKTDEEIRDAVYKYKKEIELLDNDIIYKEYLSYITDEEYVSKDRFAFIKRNYHSDATADLSNLNAPILLILGGQDTNVNSRETLQAYQDHVPKEFLNVEWIQCTDHSMLKQKYIDHPTLRTIAFVLTPKRVVSEDYLSAVTIFLEGIND